MPQAAGGNVELHIYPNVGHAFMTGFTADGIARMETIGCPVGNAAFVQCSISSTCYCHCIMDPPVNYTHSLVACMQRLDNIQEVQEQAWARLIAFFQQHLEQ